MQQVFKNNQMKARHDKFCLLLITQETLNIQTENSTITVLIQKCCLESILPTNIDSCVESSCQKGNTKLVDWQTCKID